MQIRKITSTHVKSRNITSKSRKINKITFGARGRKRKHADAKCLEAMWEARQFTDAVVACGGQAFEVHRSVLAVKSPVLASMIATDLREGSQRLPGTRSSSDS